jgi:hypothetical protein
MFKTRRARLTDALHAIELATAVIRTQAAEFLEPRRRELVLELHDLEVGRHADVEARLGGGRVALGRFAGFLRRLILLERVLHVQPGVHHFRLDVELARLEARF